MQNKVISIEIGLQATKICEIDCKKKYPQVMNCITYQTPENTVEDGYIRDKETFVSVLKEKLKEANIKGNKVVFTVASTKIANREVLIPLVKENRIQDVVNANAADYFPVDISEYIISYKLLEKIISKEEKKLRLLVLAAPSNLIKNYYNIAEMMEYEVVAIDYFGNSIYQILKREVNKGTNLIIQINEQTTLLNIMEHDILRLQRTISFGTSEILHVVLHNEEFKATNETDAVQIMYNKELIIKDFNEDEVASTIDTIHTSYEDSFITKKPTRSKGREEVMDTLRYLINNIIRVLDYYTAKYTDKKIDAIYISGQGAKLKGIVEFLNQETGVKVKKVDILNTVLFSSRCDVIKHEQSEYISCVGAVIDPIHFVPKEFRIIETKKTNYHIYEVLFLGSFLLSIALIISSCISYHSAKNENDRLNSRINAISGINKIYQDYNAAVVNFTRITEMSVFTMNPNEKLNEFISDLEQKLPTEAIVESFNVTEKDFNFSMKVDSKVTAAKVLQQLRSFSNLTNVETTGLTETEDESGLTTVRFVVTGSYQFDLEQEENNESNQ